MANPDRELPSPDWMKLYPRDFWGDGDVESLDGWHAYAYLGLLSKAWNRRGHLKDPVQALVRSGVPSPAAKSAWAGIKHLWVETDQGWTQPRLLADWTTAAQQKADSIRNGKKGGRPPGGGRGITQTGTGGLPQPITQVERPPAPAPAPAPTPAPAPEEEPRTREPALGVGKPAGGKLRRWHALKLAKYPRLCEGPLADELAPWEKHLDELLAKAYTQTGADRILAQIDRMTPERLKAAVDFSAAGNYQKLVEPRQGGGSRSAPTALERVAEIAAAVQAKPEPRTIDAEAPE